MRICVTKKWETGFIGRSPGSVLSENANDREYTSLNVTEINCCWHALDIHQFGSIGSTVFPVTVILEVKRCEGTTFTASMTLRVDGSDPVNASISLLVAGDIRLQGVWPADGSGCSPSLLFTYMGIYMCKKHAHIHISPQT